MGFLHFILIASYVAAPLVVAGFAVVRTRRARSARPAVPLIVTCVSGLFLGATLTILYALAVEGRPGLGQVLVTSYFAVAALCLLKGFSRLLEIGTMRLFGLHQAATEAHAAQTPRYYRTRFTSAFVLRALLLYAVGLPYVMAVAMVYRPKAPPRDDPYKQLGFRFEPVSFRSTDGVALDGWWIPARKPVGRDAPKPEPEWGQKTVILCHGLGANKSNQLVMAQDLVPGGYNVLAFDFRAHGASGGQLTTFGDLERRDVLGAVRWVREHRPAQAKHVFGVGASMGAAALIGAAADPGAEGQSIEAVAVIGTYDNLGSLVNSMAGYYFVPPLGWLAVHAGLPVASAHVGRPLGSFSPAREVQGLWPRPILVVHGKRDRIIDFRHGEALLDAALQPKYHFWVNDADHNAVVADPVVSRAVLLFFDNAHSII
jgi:alpha-beta hydrolase superfamily lysophospholipase